MLLKTHVTVGLDPCLSLQGEGERRVILVISRIFTHICTLFFFFFFVFKKWQTHSKIWSGTSVSDRSHVRASDLFPKIVNNKLPSSPSTCWAKSTRTCITSLSGTIVIKNKKRQKPKTVFRNKQKPCTSSVRYYKKLKQTNK